jgi:hypothetical protein
LKFIGDGGAAFLLTENPPVYLTGFLKRGKQPGNAKNSAKCGARKIEGRAFTISVLSMIGAYAK